MNHAEYESIASPDIRRELSVYGACFIAAVSRSSSLIINSSMMAEIAYIMDSGNPYAGDVARAHAAIKKAQKAKRQKFDLGTLAFADDEKVTPLQGADVVCWASRRRAVGLPFSNGFGPLESIVECPNHSVITYRPESIQVIVDVFEG